MRNLKRALSLALASVMLVGMMVVGTGAASYTDVTSEDNQEAIEVLREVGIMTGDDQGNFNPDQNVTRGEMAVIMSNLLDLGIASYAGAPIPFTDVPDWAHAYVAACYANGITGGTSETTYGTDEPITAVQAGLMMLKALGYFQYQGDFDTNGGWILATVRQAASVGLYDGIDAATEAPMTRNDIAQLALNTLEADMVEFTGDLGMNVDMGDGKSVTVGFKSEYSSRTSRDTDKYTAIEDETSVGVYAVMQLGEDLYGGDLKRDNNVRDAFGRPGTKWSYKSTSIGTFNDDPIATYTAKASKGDLYSLLGSSTVGDLDVVATFDATKDDQLIVYVDGSVVSTAGEDIKNYFVRSSSAGGASGKGVTTEVYQDNDGNVTLVYINTYVMQATNDYSENKGTINVTLKTRPSGLNVNTLDVDDFEEINGLQADDYILYTASKEGGSWDIKSVAKAEVVTGTVEAYSTGDSGYVKIDGTEYNYAKNAASDAANGYMTEYVVTDTASVVVDANGYVFYVDDASISVGNYVFIKNFAESSALSTEIIADATFTDGIKDEITIKEVYERTGGVLNATPTPITGNNNQVMGGWYAYTKNSRDEYTLKQAATTQYDAGVSIRNGKANITGVGAANADTIFLVKQTDGSKTLTVYTGITNVPDITNATVWAINSEDDGNKKLSVVYAEAAKTDIDNATTDSILVLLKHDSTYIDSADGEKVYVWKALLDGEEIDINSKTIDTSYSAGQVFEDYSIDSDGYYEAGTPFTPDDKTSQDTLSIGGGSEISVSSNTLTMGTKSYVVDEDTSINLIMLPVKGNANSETMKDEIMNDDNASYEVALGIDAGDLEGRFDGYKVAGTVYATYVDDKVDTDLLSSVYVVIRAVHA